MRLSSSIIHTEKAVRIILRILEHHSQQRSCCQSTGTRACMSDKPNLLDMAVLLTSLITDLLTPEAYQGTGCCKWLHAGCCCSLPGTTAARNVQQADAALLPSSHINSLRPIQPILIVHRSLTKLLQSRQYYLVPVHPLQEFRSTVAQHPGTHLEITNGL